eukprot:6278943-Alexandrium_andersonii.AAC.1
MFANEAAPELRPEAIPNHLRFGHPEPVADSALHRGVQHAARLGDVRPWGEVRSRLLALRPDGLELLLSPVEQPAYLRELSQQVAPRFRLSRTSSPGAEPRGPWA